MNTITDLRNTLGEHADDVPGMPHVYRLDQIQGRVRVVRRRRRATVAGVAAAAVAIAGGATLLPRHHEAQPADRDLGGHTAPKTMTSLGYTYSFDRGVEGNGKAVLMLPASDEPRLVSWATDDESASLELPNDPDGDGEKELDRVVSSATEFDDFDLVAPGAPAEFEINGEGRVGLAVYQLAEAAPGVTADGITWREQVESRHLIVGRHGDKGQADYSVTFRMPEGGFVVSDYCQGVPKDLWVLTTLNGQLASMDRCENPVYFDPAGWGWFSQKRIPAVNGGIAGPGDSITVRRFVARSNAADAEPVDAPDARLGLGVYTAEGMKAPDPLSADQPIREYDGHTYRLIETKTAHGTKRLDVPVPQDGEVLLWGISAGFDHNATWDIFRDGRLESEHTMAAAGTSYGGLIWPGEAHTLGVTIYGTPAPSDNWAVHLYERVD